MNDLAEFLRRLAHSLERFKQHRPALSRMVGWAVAIPLFALVLSLFGKKKAPASDMLDGVVTLAVIGAAFGLVEYAWVRHCWPRLKPKLKTRAGILIVAALAVVVGVVLLVIAAAPPLAPHATFYRPATLADCGWLALLLVFCFMFGVSPVGQQRAQDGSENARYIALGLALLAVVALALWHSQMDVSNHGGLPQFFRALPSHWDLLLLPHRIGLAVLALLAVVGLFHIATGWRGPFPKRGLKGAGWDIFWLVLAAGLWLCGAFVPKDFGWFDALAMPDAHYTVNLGLQALYLFLVVESGVTLALLSGGGSGRGPEPVQEDIQQQKFTWC